LSKGPAEPVFPIALSLSKGAFGMWHEGFDKLSPSGEEMGLRYLSPNGSLWTLNVAFGPTTHTRFIRRGLVPGAVEQPT
jgi:hypothetical protein